MLMVELTEKDLRMLQLILMSEIKDNENNIIKIREEGNKECYILVDALKERNDMLISINEKLHNTRKVEGEN